MPNTTVQIEIEPRTEITTQVEHIPGMRPTAHVALDFWRVFLVLRNPGDCDRLIAAVTEARDGLRELERERGERLTADLAQAAGMGAD